MKSKKKSPAAVSVINPNPQALAFSIREAAVISGLAVWAIRSAIWGGQLPARLIGKGQVILRTDLEKWVTSLPVVQHRKHRKAA